MSLLAETSQTPKTAAHVAQIPQRFHTSKATLLTDKLMNHFIKLGGIGIIAAVLGIFIFILMQTLPLFKGAKVTPLGEVQLPEDHVYRALGSDEWSELPFLIRKGGQLDFVRFEESNITQTVNPNEAYQEEITAFKYNPNIQTVSYGTSNGQVFLAEVKYRPNYQGDKRTIQVQVDIGKIYSVSGEADPIIDVAYGSSDEQKLFAVIQKGGSDSYFVRAMTLIQEQTLLGAGDIEIGDRFDISADIEGSPNRILVNSHGDGIVITTLEGDVYYFVERDGKLRLRQKFRPFEDLSYPEIASADYLFGEVSLVFTNPEGLNRIFSLYVPHGETQRSYNLTKDMAPLPGGADFYDASLRNKAYLIGSGSHVSLRYATTTAIRWQDDLSFNARLGMIGRKYKSLFLLDEKNSLKQYELNDPHPEAGFKAFFGKIWYEGYSEPSYEWQSTGGTDDFEAKLSLIPLIIGTLKGTFYAIFFAFPIALIAALYTSQFAHPKFKLFVKPTMEIMASLPSVVLGFLAALWLAPILETKVPSLIVILILLPLGTMLLGYFWSGLPIHYRKYIPAGSEWVYLLPVVIGLIWLGWQLGPWLERLLFVVTDPETGHKVADFRQWWPAVTGTPMEQRNSLVVGFMMGFAVIPIIFTIAEDSLSNVPRVLVSGSLALGASRWQTALYVVMPTAFPGIFSAMMIGLGRAVGETMIVVMATGNTPIMDFNIFSGMRTLSANIAVELPEAPYLSTLYRSLYLGAMVLFIMTFFINTFAEIIRQHFREKYKTV